MDEQFVDAMWKVARENRDWIAQMGRFGEIVNLDKMEAARRQLKMAVWLWFKEADIASIHTLTGAAFGILAGLYHHKFKRLPAPFDEQYMHEELRGYMKQLRNVMRSAEDFLKHSRKDPDKIQPISPLWTAYYIFHAIKTYMELHDGECDQVLLSLFIIRFRILCPEVFGDGPTPRFDERWDVERFKNIRSNAEFFAMVGGRLGEGPPTGN
ncbi:MAG TPA: hypothetical protein VNP98_05925 [Chthoniobacterales bacterium]|nr:hypothetical protein [Chthoniobacterales bacterium]